MSDFDSRYTIKRFLVAGPGEPDYEATKFWLEAEAFGFHSPALEAPKWLDDSIAAATVDQRELTSVFPQQPDQYFAAGRPVATFETFVKDLNVGHGKMLPARLVSGVTVRTDHRRQGILSAMMRRDLAAAHEAGQAIAALTASEGGIYRRYGFGPAIYQRKVEVDVTAGFSIDAPETGRMHVVPLSAMFDLAPQIFAQFQQRQTGSLDRQERYRYRASGQMWDDGKPDENLMAAIHVDEAGEPDGYVVYKHTGWDTKPLNVQVKDLIAGNDAAYLELWRYLGAVDLVDTIKWNEAPEVDPLPWAVNNQRRVKATESFDVIWFRILDVMKAFSARAYVNDGELTFSVNDPQGYATGGFRLSVSGGEGHVSEADPAEADIELHVADLGSLYLGSLPVSQLAAAGKVTEKVPGGVERAQSLLAPVGTVDCATYF